MIIKPKIKGFICTTAHPEGCARHVQRQIDYVQSQECLPNAPKRVLIIGASMGYGLSSRIQVAFGGSKVATIGVFFERPASGKRTASAGWYNTVAFEEKAQKAGLYARSFNGDAFSDEMRSQVIGAIKEDLGTVDMVIYSLASPRRKDPKSGEIFKSVLKPIGGKYTNTSINMMAEKLEEVSLDPATEEDVKQTVKVMGGEDWQLWIESLLEAKVVSEGFVTVAYTYVGPKLTNPIYRCGTIGQAKKHLEETSEELGKKLEGIGGRALISANKALVTQSSSAIPFIPLYFVLLTKTMQAKGIEEGCIEQIHRMFSDFLVKGSIPVDEKGFLRPDNFEMRSDVQEEVNGKWDELTQENLKDLADLDVYHKHFLELFGFGLDGVDYEADVKIEIPIPSINS